MNQTLMDRSGSVMFGIGQGTLALHFLERSLTTTNRFARRLLGVYQTVLRSPVWLNS